MSTRAEKIQQGPVQTGWGFAYWDTPQVRAGAIDLGDDINAPVRLAAKTAIQTSLNLTRPLAASSISVADVLFELWTLHGDPDGLTSWKPQIRPDANMMLRLTLPGVGVVKTKQITQGSPEWAPILRGVQSAWVAMRREVEATEQLLSNEGLSYQAFQAEYAAIRTARSTDPTITQTARYQTLRAIGLGLPPGFHARMLTTYRFEYGIYGREFIPAGETDVTPLPRGTSFSESWTSADQDSPDADLDWTEVGGSDFDIVNNEIQSVTGSSLRCVPAVGSENHFSKAVTTTIQGGSNVGVAIRFHVSAEDFNAFLVKSSTANTYRLFEVTAGSSTLMGSEVNEDPPPSAPYTTKIKVTSGGVCNGLIDDVSKITQTNDDHAGNVRGGLWTTGGASNKQDTFVVDDEATAITVGEMTAAMEQATLRQRRPTRVMTGF